VYVKLSGASLAQLKTLHPAQADFGRDWSGFGMILRLSVILRNTHPSKSRSAHTAKQPPKLINLAQIYDLSLGQLSGLWR